MQSILNLNAMNFILLMVRIILHMTPRNLLTAKKMRVYMFKFVISVFY